jgi:hypothetical protein
MPPAGDEGNEPMPEPEALPPPDDKPPPKPPLMPRPLVALLTALKQPGARPHLEAVAALSRSHAAIGFAEGLALRGDLDEARKVASPTTDPLPRLDRIKALVAIARTSLDAGQTESARQLLEAMCKVVDGERKYLLPEVTESLAGDKDLAQKEASWPLLQMIQLGLKAGLPEDLLQAQAQAIPDPALRGLAQLAIFQQFLADHDSSVDLEKARAVGDDGSLARARALESLARHNAAHGSGRSTLKAVEGWQEHEKPFGFVGAALAMQGQ